MTFIRLLGPRTKGFRRSGNAVVEFAVTLPIILSVLIGIINSGQIFWVRQVLESASREGARVFTPKTPNPTLAQQTAEKFIGLYYNSGTVPTFIAGNGGQITVTVSPNSTTSTQVQRSVTVQVPIADVLWVGNYLNLWKVTNNIVGSTTFEADQ